MGNSPTAAVHSIRLTTNAGQHFNSAISRHRDSICHPIQDRLGADPIAMVAAGMAGRIVLFLAELFDQLSPESPLDHGLLQLFEKPFFTEEILPIRTVGKRLLDCSECNR
jgi:hypothetical protein